MSARDGERCITCGDVAVEMTVIEIGDDGLALCESTGGERETTDVTLVAPVGPAERVLVHAGTAIALGGRVP